MAKLVKEIKKVRMGLGLKFKKGAGVKSSNRSSRGVHGGPKSIGRIKSQISGKKAASRGKPQAGLSEKLQIEDLKYFTHPEVKASPLFGPNSVCGAPTAKFSHGIENAELPKGYNKDIIILQVRDPWWLHAYWEVRQATYESLKNKLDGLFETAKKVLRVYDVSFINFNGSNAHHSFDIEVTRDAESWYIDTAGPGRSWCVDFGLSLASGRFITIVRSNVVTTPLDGPSWITDEEWFVPEDLFARLYGTAVGLGGSPVKLKKPWIELRKRQLVSGGISSGAVSPVKKRAVGKRQFWLVVNTELIVYGATEANAKVTVSGKPIALRPDGTFSLRFSLPDGKQIIPVRAVSFDDVEERIITPVVSKETR